LRKEKNLNLLKDNHVRLTILCDDYVQKSHLLAEHGLSFLIETKRINILFDTGQGLVIKHNAKRLNVDLKSVDAVILSHGHYDHTGGLKEILKQQSKIKVYAHPDVLRAKYRKLKTGKMKYIGYPWPLLEKNKPRFIFSKEPSWISENVLLTGEIPRKTSFEKIEEEFYVKSGRDWMKDELLDDQALVIDTPSGLVLILGCCHSGLINTLRYVAEVAARKEFSLVAGGIHLKDASRERIDKTINVLHDFNIQTLVLSHCTGIFAFSRIHEALGDKVLLGSVGEAWKT